MSPITHPFLLGISLCQVTRASHCPLTCLHSSKDLCSSLALSDEQFWGSDLITKCHFFARRSSILSQSTLPSKWLLLCKWDKALEQVRRHVPKGQAHLHRMSVWALHQHEAHITEATLVPCSACSSSEKCFHNSPGTQIPMKQPKDQASGSVPECTGAVAWAGLHRAQARDSSVQAGQVLCSQEATGRQFSWLKQGVRFMKLWQLGLCKPGWLWFAKSNQNYKHTVYHLFTLQFPILPANTLLAS